MKTHNNRAELKVIARIHNDFTEKFGIPHQSGRLNCQKAVIVFEPEYRVAEAFRGLEEYTHIWLIWQFSENVRDTWSPTVRPPRLGGNVRKGVFATRSPFRPNSLGLSSVRLESVEFHRELGPVLHVSGADLMDGTPIFDIKPYIPTDSHPEASGGFTEQIRDHRLMVVFPDKWLSLVRKKKESLSQKFWQMIRGRDIRQIRNGYMDWLTEGWTYISGWKGMCSLSAGCPGIRESRKKTERIFRKMEEKKQEKKFDKWSGTW